MTAIKGIREQDSFCDRKTFFTKILESNYGITIGAKGIYINKNFREMAKIYMGSQWGNKTWISSLRRFSDEKVFKDADRRSVRGLFVSFDDIDKTMSK